MALGLLIGLPAGWWLSGPLQLAWPSDERGFEATIRLALICGLAMATVGFCLGNLAIRSPRLGALQMTLATQAVAVLFLMTIGWGCWACPALGVYPVIWLIALPVIVVTFGLSVIWTLLFRLLRGVLISPEAARSARIANPRDGLTVGLTVLASVACLVAAYNMLAAGFGPGP